MQEIIEFSHAPLAAGGSEAALLAAVLRFEAEVLATRPSFGFHALLREDGGARYAHLVVVESADALVQLVAEGETLPAFHAVGACLDLGAMVVQQHRPLEPFRVPTRFGALEVGSFAPRGAVERTRVELVQRSAALRDGYLRAKPEFLEQTVCSVGERRFAELVFADSLAHMKQTCAGYLQDERGRALVELADPETCELTYWVPLLLRDLRALRARAAS